MIVQKCAEELGAHTAAAVLLVLHDQKTVLRLSIEAAMTDEMEDVILPAAEAARARRDL